MQAVHAEGGRIFPQLWHVGAVREPGTEVSLPTSTAGPSGLDGLGEAIAEPMTTADIDRTSRSTGGPRPMRAASASTASNSTVPTAS